MTQRPTSGQPGVSHISHKGDARLPIQDRLGWATTEWGRHLLLLVAGVMAAMALLGAACSPAGVGRTTSTEGPTTALPTSLPGGVGLAATNTDQQSTPAVGAATVDQETLPLVQAVRAIKGGGVEQTALSPRPETPAAPSKARQEGARPLAPDLVLETMTGEPFTLAGQPGKVLVVYLTEL